jgi:hypothetical protein
MGDQVGARRAAARFIETNAGPSRYIAVVNFTGIVRIAQNFTPDVERLKQAVDGPRMSAVSPIGRSVADLASTGMPSLAPGSVAADFGMRRDLMALRNLAKSLAGVPAARFIQAAFVPRRRRRTGSKGAGSWKLTWKSTNRLLKLKSPVQLGLRLRLLDAETGQQRWDSGSINLSGLANAGDAVVPQALRLPVAGLAPGAYRARFAIQDSAGAQAVREAEFRLE